MEIIAALGMLLRREPLHAAAPTWRGSRAIRGPQTIPAGLTARGIYRAVIADHRITEPLFGRTAQVRRALLKTTGRQVMNNAEFVALRILHDNDRAFRVLVTLTGHPAAQPENTLDPLL